MKCIYYETTRTRNRTKARNAIFSLSRSQSWMLVSDDALFSFFMNGKPFDSLNVGTQSYHCVLPVCLLAGLLCLSVYVVHDFIFLETIACVVLLLSTYPFILYPLRLLTYVVMMNRMASNFHFSLFQFTCDLFVNVINSISFSTIPLIVHRLAS